MVLSFVNCKKIVFSLVNGPAIGIGATIVGLCDVAWCSETVNFDFTSNIGHKYNQFIPS